MKILQLCNKPPFPSYDGGSIAMGNITSGLVNAGIDVKVLTVSTDKHPFKVSKFPPKIRKAVNPESVYIDVRLNIVDAFSCLVTRDSYNVSRFFSPDFEKKLITILDSENFDLVHLESIFMTPYLGTIKRHSKAKIVLRSHNLEYLIWERLSDTEGKKLKKLYLKHLAKNLKAYELDVINKVDAIASISSKDTDRFQELKCKVPIRSIPFGICLTEIPYQEKTKAPKEVSFFHIGSMDWSPNQEGILWLIDKVIKKTNDSFKIQLAGRNMPDWLLREESQKIAIHGEVDSAYDFMNQYDVMVVPLLSASGIRVKIIEGMALGKTIISTSIGAEGIGYTDGENILIADTPKQFREKIQYISDNPKEIIRIGKNARELIEGKFDNEKIINELIEFYNELF
ncbi:MAG: glycosyltransferase family 4 protein [Crocinitomicaceae bacterium]|nr:glycosyltransferase family 4 protein [Crocinitomicaceae bacterium]